MTATSPLQALKLARTHSRDTVVAVHLSAPTSVRFLQTSRTTGARVLAITELNTHSSFRAADWQKAIAITATTPTLGLAVRPGATTSSSDLSSYLALLSSTGSAPADISPAAAGSATPPPSASVPSSVVCNAERSVTPTVKAVFAAAACTVAVGAGVTASVPSPSVPRSIPSGGVTPAAAPGGANIWVSPSGDDSAGARCSPACADPGPAHDFLTFSAAYAAAQPGDAVTVDCGSYPDQSFPYTLSKGSGPAVVFDGGNCVTVGGGAADGSDALNHGISSEVSWVTLQNMRIAGSLALGDVPGCVAQVTPDHDSAIGVTANRFYSQGATNFYVAGSSFGPIVNNNPAGEVQSFLIGCSVNGVAASGTFTGNTIHDVTQAVAGLHINGLYLDGIDNGITISGNRFENIAQSDLSIDTGIGDNSNITVVNNYFDAPCSHSGVNGAGDNAACGAIAPVRLDCHSDGTTISHMTIINNTLDGSFHASTPDGGSCVFDTATNLFTNNLMNAYSGAAGPGDCTRPGYLGGWTVSYNVSASGYACGTGSITNATIGFPDPSGYDFSISCASSAIGLVPTSQLYPSTDIDGHARPARSGSFIDAGAYESTC